MQSSRASLSPRQWKPWRDGLPIHPAVEFFPLMPPAELPVLGENIKKNGLTSPIVLWRPHPQAPVQLLDGRNRLDAIEIARGRSDALAFIEYQPDRLRFEVVIESPA